MSVIERPDSLFIDGQWRSAEASGTRDVIDPFDARVTAVVAEGDRVDAEAAVAAARRAFDRGPWPRLTWVERAEVVARLGALVTEHREELAALETRDTGKTLEESRWDMDDVAEVCAWFAQLGREHAPETLHPPEAGANSEARREPVGVCALICPWNYPLLQVSWKLAPALVAGCTMVLKPSEITPLTTIRVTELAAEAGVPDGVLNTVLGPGATVGAALVDSPDVDMVSFTGGVVTVERFSSEDEAVARANDTVYGLSAGFWTRDEARIERVASALRFGTVWINDFNVYFAAAPWGGFKRSGNGRELGRVGLDEYTEVKHVYRRLEPRPLGWF